MDGVPIRFPVRPTALNIRTEPLQRGQELGVDGITVFDGSGEPANDVTVNKGCVLPAPILFGS